MTIWQPRFRSRLYRLRRYRHIVAVLVRYGFEEVAGALQSRLRLRFGELFQLFSLLVRIEAAGMLAVDP